MDGEHITAANSVIDNLDDWIDRKPLERTLEIIKDNDTFKYIYAKSVEPNFKVETKNEVYSIKYDNDALQRFIDDYEDKYKLNDISSNEADNYVSQIFEACRPQLNQKYSNNESSNSLINVSLKNLQEYFYEKIGYKLQKYGSDNQVLDRTATNEKVNKVINQENYNKWVDNLLKNVIEKRGLRNNLEYNGNRGNPGSFDQLNEK